MSTLHYDTCVFENSLNRTSSEHEACVVLVDPEQAVWPISLCELAFAEATVGEYIEQWTVACTLAGRNVVVVGASDAKKSDPQGHCRKKLRSFGMTDHDILQAQAAKAARATVFVTTDQDFIDPDRKRGGTGSRVHGLLRGCGIEVSWPSMALEKARAAVG